MREAVLLDVVAQPEHQRRVDLRLLGRDRLGQARGGGVEPPGGVQIEVEVEVAQQQVLLELRRAGERLAGVVDDEGVTVEQQLVLAADEPAERDRDPVFAGAPAEHALPVETLAGVVGRGGDVHDQPRAVGRLLRAGGPGSQMSSQTVNPTS